MTYVQGFLTPVPVARRQAYVDHATTAQRLFAEFGIGRMVEAWGDDVPDGKLNDFNRAVHRADDEAVLFSWIEYPDKPTYAQATQRIMTDPRMDQLGDMPFDGRRMMFGGFDVILDEGDGGGTGYVDGFVLPVAEGNRAAYLALARTASAVFLEHGVTRYVEAWGDDVPAGHTTDFHRAAHAEAGETVVFSWCEWPDKATRDRGMAAVMADARMKTPPADMPFDGKRMIYGGFIPVLDK